MKLSDLKRLTARKTMEISFPLPDGKECVVDSKGIARVPGLNSPPSFNLEQCAAEASTFQVRTAPGGAAKRTGRAEVEAMVAALSGSAPAPADHDE
jgi:hypothetical protein